MNSKLPNIRELMLDVPLGQTLFFLCVLFSLGGLAGSGKEPAEICCILFVQKLDKKYDGQSTTKPCQRHRFRYFVVDLIAKFLHCTVNKICSKSGKNSDQPCFSSLDVFVKM